MQTSGCSQASTAPNTAGAPATGLMDAQLLRGASANRSQASGTGTGAAYPDGLQIAGRSVRSTGR